MTDSAPTSDLHADGSPRPSDCACDECMNSELATVADLHANCHAALRAAEAKVQELGYSARDVELLVAERTAELREQMLKAATAIEVMNRPVGQKFPNYKGWSIVQMLRDAAAVSSPNEATWRCPHGCGGAYTGPGHVEVHVAGCPGEATATPPACQRCGQYVCRCTQGPSR